jgi:hypothetical protein
MFGIRNKKKVFGCVHIVVKSACYILHVRLSVPSAGRISMKFVDDFYENLSKEKKWLKSGTNIGHFNLTFLGPCIIL